MARALAVLLCAAAAAVVAVLLASDPRLPPNPHAALDAPDQCPSCHSYYLGALEPHEFVVSVPEKCWVCHPKEVLGRSHPIGVKPRTSSFPIVVPEEIPLEQEGVSCGSCHRPHAEWLSLAKAFPAQVPFVTLVDQGHETSYYKTLYLRVPGDPETGFLSLCTACHRDY